MSGKALSKSLAAALSLMPLLACTAGFGADQSALVPAVKQTAKAPVVEDSIPTEAPESSARKGTTGATQQYPSIPTATVRTYLLSMQPLTQQYLEIMLSLLGWEGDVTPAQVSALGQQLAKVKAPPAVASEQAELTKSLTIVNAFLVAGGAQEQGFHKALLVARKMQQVSDDYHRGVLELATAHGLPKSIDPFLAHTKPVVVKGQPQVSKLEDMNNLELNPKANSGRISNKTLRALGEQDSISHFSAVESNPSSPPSFIDGVGGTMGISGMFNGLGGTGTNGLVDGMGVSSGMNGWVNGAGLSTGMSGMLNNNTDSGSGAGLGK